MAQHKYLDRAPILHYWISKSALHTQYKCTLQRRLHDTMTLPRQNSITLLRCINYFMIADNQLFTLTFVHSQLETVEPHLICVAAKQRQSNVQVYSKGSNAGPIPLQLCHAVCLFDDVRAACRHGNLSMKKAMLWNNLHNDPNMRIRKYVAVLAQHCHRTFCQ